MVKIIKGIGFAIAIVLVVAVMPALTASQDIQAQSGSWSLPRRLGTGWWQSITVDPQGRTHVGWYDVLPVTVSRPDGTKTTTDGDILRYASVDLDGNWTIPNDVEFTGLGGYTVRNALAVTSDGVLHALFRSVIRHEYASAYSTTASDASTWTPSIQLNESSYYMHMIADSNDILHVAYSGKLKSELEVLNLNLAGNLERNPCALCGDVIYMQSTNSGKTWTSPRALMSTSTTGSDKMEFMEGNDGRIYLTWDEGLDWYQGRGNPQDVEMMYSDDSGETWVGPIAFDGGNIAGRRPMQIALTEMTDGTLMIVWRYSSDEVPQIYYQTSSDGAETWTEPEAIPDFVARRLNDTPLDDYALLTDNTGTVHLFAVGYPDAITLGNPSLYHIIYRQGFWLPPQRLFYSPEMWPEWPKAALGLQNDIHLTWFTRTINEQLGFTDEQAADPDYLNVYYSHMEGNFPLQPTVEFKATTTPNPSPTPFQVLDPTLTPFPTFQVEYRSSFAATQDQYVTETLVGSMAVTLFFCGLVVLVIRLRRS